MTSKKTETKKKTKDTKDEKKKDLFTPRIAKVTVNIWAWF